jgi:hypothetical protein
MEWYPDWWYKILEANGQRWHLEKIFLENNCREILLDEHMVETHSIISYSYKAIQFETEEDMIIFKLKYT